ncbi:MAG: hypothetical protein GYB66_13615 [Chloroflexi bacterium]|nr:hypothetical protein [Chloroflexota bacterium]
MAGQQGQLIKDAVAWLSAIAVFVILLIVVEVNAIISLIIAILVFAGLFLILNPKVITNIVAPRRFSDSPATARIKISQVRNLTTMIDRHAMRDSAQRICELATAVILEVEQRPNAPRYIFSKINHLFDVLMPQLGKYVGASSGHQSMQPHQLEALATQIEEDILAPLEASLRNLAQDPASADFTQLDQTARQLETMAKQ